MTRDRPNFKIKCPATGTPRTFRHEGDLHTASFAGHCSLCGNSLSFTVSIVDDQPKFPRKVQTVCNHCISQLQNGRWPIKTLRGQMPVPDFVRQDCGEEL